MPDEPVERSIRDYIANGAVEGAMAAAQRITEAAGVGLNEVLAAVSHEAAAALSGTGTLTAGAIVLPPAQVAAVAHAGEVVIEYPADTGSATDSLSVVRKADVDKLGDEASRGKLPAILQSMNHRILVAVVLLAAIYPVLPPEVQSALNTESALMASIAAILALLKS